LASYPDATFQRDFIGAVDTASFQLTDLTGSAVGFSIDPFFFSVAVPEPATLALLGASLLGFAALHRRKGDTPINVVIKDRRDLLSDE